MNIKKMLALVLSGMLMLSLAACGGEDANNIVIGGLAPLTGDVAVYGVAAKNGAELAFKEINDAGGIGGKKIVFKVLDEKGEVNEAVNSYENLKSQKIVALLGDVTSKPTMAVAQIAAEDRMPMITATATAEAVTTYGDNIFRVCFLDPYQGQTMAQFAAQNLQAKKAAIIYNNADDYSTGVAEAFEKAAKEKGMEVVAKESYGADDKLFKSQLTKIAAQNPDVLFIPDYYNRVALIASQAKEVGITATLLGADGWDGIFNDPNVDASTVEGAYFCNHYSTEDEAKEVQDFIKAYSEAYGQQPNSFAALGYDAAKILAKAIEKAGSNDKEAIIKALQETEYDGVTGHIKFKNGNPIKSVSIIKIVNGQYTLDSKITAE
ncbi:MAG: ABC transporter substrate-binding protein [Clostridiaceae bacterium]|nr:ABC transporter substrate-binding protein [Clostridiaceae bacterium]